MVNPSQPDAMGDAEARRREWSVARHYAHLLQQGTIAASGEGEAGVDPGISLAPSERASFRTIVVVERFHGWGDAGLRPNSRARGWGDRQGASVVATSERLVVNHRLRGWESFWLVDLIDYDTSLHEPTWLLDLTWSSARLRLSGLAIPLLAVFVASTTQPRSWVTDPRLALLMR
jgi:hypothetical protein